MNKVLLGAVLVIAATPNRASGRRGKASQTSPADQLALLVVLVPINLAPAKASIENVERRVWASRPIRDPDKNSGEQY